MKKLQDLNKVYADAESIDREIFAEQRSNILLVAGEHYARRGSKYYNQIRDNRELTETQKLRLTKNHIHRASRHYKASILSFASTMKAVPKNETEMQDQKAAELNQMVMDDIKDRYRMKEKLRQKVADFVDIGEACWVIKWEPNAGSVVGYNQKLDDQGQPMADETGAPLADESSPVFEGGFLFERTYGMNVLRHAAAKEMGESECIIVRKMVDKKDLEKKYQDDPEKLQAVKGASGEDFVVFDASKGNYRKTEDQILVREFYYKSCQEYPEGYFYIATSAGILEEDVLPKGIFPVVWGGWDIFQNSPRGRSFIKVARPYQAEINRAGSAIAMHQITLGDDKILYQAGTKLSSGALLPGVRGLTFQGATPQVLPGRDGSQYAAYVDAQISEMDRVLMLPEEDAEMPTQLDPHALLFRSVRDRKRFSEYQEKFEQFEQDFWWTTLELAKYYMSDEQVARAIGKDEISNIEEFRNTNSNQFVFKLMPQDDTADTMLGKHLSIQSILQYAGSQLERDDIGKLISLYPFLNEKEMFSDFTLDYQVMQNDMLAMERGKQVEPSPYVAPDYAIRKITHRKKQPSYEFLPEEIKSLYENYYQQLLQIQQEQQQAEIDAKNEYIPVGGAMIACDMYMPSSDPQNPDKTSKRVRVPYQALDWLVQKLDTQGASLDNLETMNQGNLADMARMGVGSQGGQSSGGQGLPPAPGPQ